MKKILSALNEKGIRTCVAIAFDRLVPKWLLRVRRFNVYEMDPGFTTNASSTEVTVQWSHSEDETANVEKFMGPQRSVVDVGADEMRVCYAKVNGQLAGAFWAADNVFMESGLTIRYLLSEEQTWLFAAYVEKQYRRQKVYSHILEFMLPDLAESGKSQLLLAVNPDNTPSKKVHEKYARRQLGTAIAIRFLSMAFCSVRGQMKTNRTFTWNHKSKPVVIQFDRD